MISAARFELTLTASKTVVLPVRRNGNRKTVAGFEPAVMGLHKSCGLNPKDLSGVQPLTAKTIAFPLGYTVMMPPARVELATLGSSDQRSTC